MKVALIGVFLSVVTAGCSHIQQFEAAVSKRQLARDAWESARDVPRTGRHAKHWERGWKQGYYDVASGGSGRPPVLPPKRYWAVKYQNPEGQQIVQNWFQGYQLGAMAAEQDGVRDLNYLSTSPLTGYVSSVWPVESSDSPIVPVPTDEQLPDVPSPSPPRK